MYNPAGPMVSGTGGLVRKSMPSPEEVAKAGRYLLPDGTFYIPAFAIRSSILEGAKGYRIGKSSAVSILSGAILIADGAFPLLRDNKALNGDEYSVFSTRAVVQGQGIIRSRPRIELPWQVKVTFNYIPDVASLAQIEGIANRAGQIIGLLDYRPKFGRYEVTNIWSE